MASMLIDFLVTDALYKSDGAIDFPSEFIEGYGYMQNKFYGHKKGKWYREDVWLWMPAKLIETGSVELNYISARGENTLYVALSNQSAERVKSWIRINENLVKLNPQTVTKDQHGKVHKIEAGIIDVTVPPHGQISLVVKNAQINPTIQDKLLSQPSLGWKNDYLEIETGNARAMIIAIGDLVQNLYLYLRDDDEVVREVSLIIKGADGNQVLTDKSFPFEFTVPVEKEVTFKLSCKKTNGLKTASEWITMN